MSEPFLTIKETQDALLQKTTTVDLVDNYMARIKAFDKDLNSFIAVSDEYAYSKAKKAEKLISSMGGKAFEEFPLLGVVMGIKDIYLTKDIQTTAGSNVLKGYIPPYSSSVVEKLEKAGAIIIGKTNLDAWAHGASGENSDFGPTKNPWDTTRVPGGSSSGSAASVSARLALASMGTDTGGSIRLPASFCGVVGFKPTYAAVSRYGIISMASSLDSVGHFTRTVDDTETIFNITKGTDDLDGTLKEQSFPAPDNITIGLPEEYFDERIDKEVKASVLNAVEELKKHGFKFKEVSLPHTKYAVAAYYIIQPAEVSSNLGRFDGIRYGFDRSHFSAEAKRRIMLGSHALSSGHYDAYYAKAQKVRTLIVNEYESVFTQVDALLMPTSPTPAFKLGEKASDPLKMYLSDSLTVSANLAGLPGISIPSGFSESGLPISFQVLAEKFHENTLFEIGKIYQKNTDWHKKTPSLQ